MTVPWSRVSVVDIATELRTGQSGVRTPLGARDLSLLHNVQIGSGAHPISPSVGTGVEAAGA
jgi:hypothetical protein